MPKPRISPVEGGEAVAHVQAGTATNDTVALAVRYLLQVLEQSFPGKSVEVRIPPYGAIQCVEGPEHTRGTPAHVVEMDPQTWVGIATGTLNWDDAVAKGLLRASGTRSNLSSQLPLAQW
jgi:hypothetical protein